VSEVFLKRVSGEIHSYRVLSATPHKSIVLVKLEGVNSLEEADKLRETEVWVAAEAIPRKEGEYFWHELIGLTVLEETGEYIGELAHIIPVGASEIYVVTCGKKEIFIPATYDVVREIDLEKGTMTISPMEGLLDLNEI
jgi:16S rRNA processing protein RimM